MTSKFWHQRCDRNTEGIGDHRYTNRRTTLFARFIEIKLPSRYANLRCQLRLRKSGPFAAVNDIESKQRIVGQFRARPRLTLSSHHATRSLGTTRAANSIIRSIFGSHLPASAICSIRRGCS